PVFEFASFDPETEEYIFDRTEPIPIKIMPLQQDSSSKPEAQPAALPWQSTLNEVEVLEIEGYHHLDSKDLHALPLASWWNLLLLPLGVGLLLLQIELTDWIAKQKATFKPPSSEEIFKLASNAPAGSADQLSLWEKAFLLRLYELKLIERP